MADEDATAHEIIIVKRRGGGHEEGHGSTAWKIAFADFMTAMMALFLVLWLTNATDEKAKKQIATYFNPIELTNDTASARGVKTLDEENTKETKDLRDRVRNVPSGSAGEGQGNLDSGPEHADKQLFSDPYDLVRRLASQANVNGIGTKQESEGSPATGAAVHQGKAYRDPFDPVFRSETVALAKKINPGEERTGQESTGTGESKWEQLSEEAKKLERQAAAEKALKAELKREARLVHAAIKKSIGGVAPENVAEHQRDRRQGRRADQPDRQRAIRHVCIGFYQGRQRTDRADGQDRRHSPRRRRVRSWSAVIRTPRPFRSADNDNWRLSMGRAHTAYDLLLVAGIPEDRFEKIEGYADKDLRDKADPNSAVNRRIEILLRREPK